MSKSKICIEKLIFLIVGNLSTLVLAIVTQCACESMVTSLKKHFLIFFFFTFVSHDIVHEIGQIEPVRWENI